MAAMPVYRGREKSLRASGMPMQTFLQSRRDFVYLSSPVLPSAGAILRPREALGKDSIFRAGIRA